MATYGYARCSSLDQNEARQIDALNELNISAENIYTDKISGKDFEHPAYRTLTDFPKTKFYSQFLRSRIIHVALPNRDDPAFCVLLDECGTGKCGMLQSNVGIWRAWISPVV